jgi:hypothetical protein
MEWYYYAIVSLTIILIIFIIAWLTNYKEVNKLGYEVNKLMNRNKYLESQNKILNEIVTPIKMMQYDKPTKGRISSVEPV